jgi:hypothetical protein
MIPLVLLGILGIAYVLTRSSVPTPTSPPLFVANSSAPVVTPLPTGLPAGWYLEDLGNTQPIAVGQAVKAIAMSPDDVASAVYGVAVASGPTVSFQSTSTSAPGFFVPPGMAAPGVMMANPPVSTFTLPLSYVVTSNAADPTWRGGQMGA